MTCSWKPSFFPGVLECEGRNPELAGAPERPLVVLLTHLQILPATQGNRIAVRQMALWLRQAGYRVFLLNQIPPDQIAGDLEELCGLFDHVYCVDPSGKAPGSRHRRVCDGDRYHENTAACLDRIHESFGIHAVIAEYIYMTTAMHRLPAAVKKFVQTIDVHYRLTEELEHFGITTETRRRITREQEAELLRYADVLIAIQDHEAHLLADLVPDRRVITVGLAADPAWHPSTVPANPASVLFTGSQNPLNVRGLQQFMASCWEGIRAQFPAAELRVVGGVCEALDAEFRQRFKDGISYLGVLDDLQAEFNRAAVVVNCTDLGTGLKIKTIEAIARGKAIVSTPAGVEGIPPLGLSPYLVASSMPEFQEHVIALLNRPELRAAVEKDARRYARAYLSFDYVYRHLAAALDMQFEAREDGTVHWFVQERSFGFIRPRRGGRMLFFHKSDIAPGHAGGFQEGQPVSYVPEETLLGMEAHDVRPAAVAETGLAAFDPSKDIKRVVFFGINSATDFSGGRYHAWLMAEAAAEMGWNVSYITNHVPSFYPDFADPALFPAHDRIQVHVCPIQKKGACTLPDIPCDVLVVIPHGSVDPSYGRALEFAARTKARIALLNFESANWFNALSPKARAVACWNGWRRISESASMIFSLAAEGTGWAREFYDTAPPTALFEHLWPTVNSRVADAVGEVAKEKRILILTRFAYSEHKGGNLVPEMLCEAMRGHTIVFIVGVGAPDEAFMRPIEEKAAEFGISIEILHRISEHEKWREFKRAALVLFPSYFEGFGLPPLEALYAGVPCIAFDLPVLREVSGDGICYVAPGDTAAMREKIAALLGASGSEGDTAGQRDPVLPFEDFARRVDVLLQRACHEG